jgi:hypothetical protein
MPYDAPDWYLRFHTGLPARPEDRDAIMRFAPELFNRNFRPEDYPSPGGGPTTSFGMKSFAGPLRTSGGVPRKR